jgi:hypothetical protein
MFGQLVNNDWKDMEVSFRGLTEGTILALARHV